MKISILFLLFIILAGCGKKKAVHKPEVEAAMKTPVTCVRCQKTAERQFYHRVSQVLVRCPGCQKTFPVKNKSRKR